MKTLISSIGIISLFSLISCKVTCKNDLNNQGFYKLSRFSSNDVKSDSSMVMGHFFDLKFQSSLPYSVVIIKDSKLACMADECGDFKIKLAPGRYTLVFQSAGNTELMTTQINIKANTRYHFVVYLDSYSIH